MNFIHLCESRPRDRRYIYHRCMSWPSQSLSVWHEPPQEDIPNARNGRDNILDTSHTDANHSTGEFAIAIWFYSQYSVTQRGLMVKEWSLHPLIYSTHALMRLHHIKKLSSHMFCFFFAVNASSGWLHFNSFGWRRNWSLFF